MHAPLSLSKKSLMDFLTALLPPSILSEAKMLFPQKLEESIF